MTMVKLLVVLGAMVMTLGWADPTDGGADSLGAQESSSSFWTDTVTYLIEHAFELAILLVFVGAILSSYLSRRLRDRCLKHFEKFPVTLECKDGRRYRGVLDAENNGLEVTYQDVEEEGAGSRRESFLLYQGEYAQLQAVVCYPETLNEKQQKRRKRAIKRAYTPGLLRRLSRRIRNFYAAIKDAFSEAFLLILGRMKTRGPQAEVLKSQEKYVGKMGSEVMGAVASASFDPILERQIGRRVLAEEVGPDSKKHYHEGFLREYSKDFIELQDVPYPDVYAADLPEDGAEHDATGLHVQRWGKELRMENKGSAEIRVDIISGREPGDGADASDSGGICIAPGEGQSTAVPEDAQSMKLRIIVQKKADVLLPRHSAVVRHRVR